MEKSRDAFRTISEVAEYLQTPAHVLRFWESRFPQIRPVKRAGGRRYYRPTDVALLSGIKHLLHGEGLTIRGVQKVLREHGIRHVMSIIDTGAGVDPIDIGSVATVDETARDAQVPVQSPPLLLGEADAARGRRATQDPLPLWSVAKGSPEATPITDSPIAATEAAGQVPAPCWIATDLRALSPARVAAHRPAFLEIFSRLSRLRDRLAEAADSGVR